MVTDFDHLGPAKPKFSMCAFILNFNQFYQVIDSLILLRFDISRATSTAVMT
jgi:hypothetical protein